MIVNIEDNLIIVGYQEDGTTVEARSENPVDRMASSTWMSTVAFGAKTADLAREASREYAAIAIFLAREKRVDEDTDPGVYTVDYDVANKLRQAYYEDASATIDKSEHPQQWFRMARAALKKD